MTQTINARVVVGGVDLTSRTLRIRGRQGRSGTLIARASPSTCQVRIGDDDGYVGVLDRSRELVAETLIGEAATVEARVGTGSWHKLFEGYVDDVVRQEQEGRATADLLLLDINARLANTVITLPSGTPAELTGARIRRVLSLAGVTDFDEIDDGTVTCAALTKEESRTALVWCNDCALTEGGIFWPHAGRLSFLERQTKREVAAHIGDATDAMIQPDGAPSTESQQSLRVSSVSWTSYDGSRGVEGNQSTGVRGAQVTTLSDAQSTIDLAEWWLTAFSTPQTAPREVRLVAHAQPSESVANSAVALSLGDTITLQWLPQGSTSNVIGDFIIDRITWSISPLDGQGRVVYLSRLRFVPPIVTVRWTLGESALGDNTLLAPRGARPAGDPPDRAPAGRSSWSDGEFVAHTSFAAWLTAQTIPRYETEQARDLAEGSCDHGQLCYVATIAEGPFLCHDGWAPV